MQNNSHAARITLYDGLRDRPVKPAALSLRNSATADPGDVGGRQEDAAADPDGKAAALRAVLMERRRPLIEAALEAIRPNLRRDGGDCELVEIVGDAVRVKLSGACVGCQLASLTLSGVRQKLIEATGMPTLRLIPIN
ncbi:NifU family protein [Rhizobium sp. CG5]|uniref:NifU family protein n=1 Tax=Rhizobium sp. CG5 TaxID=2726076 RepID=UPI0020331DA9|nr:NifU family protein [Rhizobium sp. CG5]MCM2474623.1 NifU family protein [Rhizobium sp. CG5]